MRKLAGAVQTFCFLEIEPSKDADVVATIAVAVDVIGNICSTLSSTVTSG